MPFRLFLLAYAHQRGPNITEPIVLTTETPNRTPHKMPSNAAITDATTGRLRFYSIDKLLNRTTDLISIMPLIALREHRT